MAKKRPRGESFAMVVFASEWPRHPELHPGRTHTFAAFIHEKRDGQIDHFVISWLPKNGVINGFLQIGANFLLQESLDWSLEGGMAVYAWHAYEIKEALFESALRRVTALNSGSFRYYFFGTGPRNLNCTHALSGLDILPLPDVKLAIYGVNASWACLDRMGSWSWQSDNPGRYERVLQLPANKIKWLEYGRPLKAAGAIDPKQYFTSFAKDLPSRLEINDDLAEFVEPSPKLSSEAEPEIQAVPPGRTS